MAFTCEGIILGGEEAAPYLCLSPDQKKVVQLYLLLEYLFGLDMGGLSNEVIAFVTNWMATHNADVTGAATIAMLAAASDDTRSANALWAAAQDKKLHCWPSPVRDAFIVLLSCYMGESQRAQ